MVRIQALEEAEVSNEEIAKTFLMSIREGNTRRTLTSCLALREYSTYLKFFIIFFKID